MTAGITPGIYRHFRGNRYRVYGTARHSEDDQTMVLYRALYGTRELWVRPLSMFDQNVMHEGEEKKRFELLEASTSELDLLLRDD